MPLHCLLGNEYVKVSNRYLREDGSIGTWTFPLDHFLFDTLYAKRIFQNPKPSEMTIEDKLTLLNKRANENYVLRENSKMKKPKPQKGVPRETFKP